MEGNWYPQQPVENFKQYNGKELNEEFGLNWNDYGARWYDSAIGRWTSVDPLAEEMPSWSTYNYTFDNPVLLTDPDGMAPDDRWKGVIGDDGSVSYTWQSDEGGDNVDIIDYQDSQGNSLGTATIDVEVVEGGATTIAGEVYEPGLRISSSSQSIESTSSPIEGGIAVAKKAGLNVVKSIVGALSKSKAKPKTGSSGGPGAGKPFSAKTKDAAEKQARSRCVFCQNKTTRQKGPRQRNTDHADPKSRGGNNTLPNAQNTCRTCNQEKRARTTKEYLEYLKSKNKN